uniref:EcoEI_R_C domain-containing protein n=1 Tax=Steinernema glaseri TaxID=37863 RepID=A0A1I8A7B9_9BILA
MNVSDADVDELLDVASQWNFTQVYERVYSKLRSQALRLIEEYGPPLSFVDALSALTVEQKAHVEELAKGHQKSELERIFRGLIASLPFEDQHQLRSQALRLIEEYGPPLSFVDALSALTVEQKAHVEELAKGHQKSELERISRGLIASLPFEDQHQVGPARGALTHN